MLTQKDQLEILLEKSEWTAEERAWLLDYLMNSDGTVIKELMQGLFLGDIENSKLIDSDISEKLLSSIHQKVGINKKQEKAKLARMWTQRIGAACIIGLMAFATYQLVKNKLKSNTSQLKTNNNKYKNDVEPGGDKAVLTLADGSAIVLDDASNGALTRQGNARVIKINGKLSYNPSGNGNNEILYNVIATPRGGQYQVELTDGTKVWLNAASSIRFPTVFAGIERRVEISGEVYFEVAKHTSMPFIVAVKGAEIQVVGTRFNVMAYNDESALQTTLLEGAVKFASDANNTMLRPGQQLQLLKDGQLNLINDVDLEKVIAWKNGFFDFEGSAFENISKQLSRWYNVEVIYDRKIDDLFYAEIPRDTKLSDVLQALELTGKVHFEIDGRKILVLP